MKFIWFLTFLTKDPTDMVTVGSKWTSGTILTMYKVVMSKMNISFVLGFQVEDVDPHLTLYIFKAVQYSLNRSTAVCLYGQIGL